MTNVEVKVYRYQQMWENGTPVHPPVTCGRVRITVFHSLRRLEDGTFQPGAWSNQKFYDAGRLEMAHGADRR